MNLFDLSYSHYLYRIFTNYDNSLNDLNTIINNSLDLNNLMHIQALLNWLNRWGCRHISIESHEELKYNLRVWWNNTKELINKTETKNREDIIKIFNSLCDVIVIENDNKTVKFGPTATAKTLFILNSKYFIPWDIKIRKDYGNSGDSYYKFLVDAKNEIYQMKKDSNINEKKWEKIILRMFPDYISDMKLMDEYYWITKTKNIQIDKEQIINLLKNEDV